MLTCDMLDVNVSQSSDSVGYHEVLHQLGIEVGYLAGMQEALVAGVPCLEHPNDQHLVGYLISLALLKPSASG